MATRWERYYERQMQSPEMRALVEEELVRLRLGVKIARMRAKEHLSQTELAARAGMSTSKISAIENSPKNVELATLVRLARAMGHEVRMDFVPRKGIHQRAAIQAKARSKSSKKGARVRVYA